MDLTDDKPALVLVMAWYLQATTFIYIFIPFLESEMVQVIEIFFVEKSKAYSFRSQYHGSGWAGAARSQGISNHGVDLVLPEYCKKIYRWVCAITPLLMHWSYVFLALTHWYANEISPNTTVIPIHFPYIFSLDHLICPCQTGNNAIFKMALHL